jgi:hypothetical protein
MNTSETTFQQPVVEHPKMTVIGTGYLGATHAICMAILGFDVLGVDVDQNKIDQLRHSHWPPGVFASRPASMRRPSSETCTSSASARPRPRDRMPPI